MTAGALPELRQLAAEARRLYGACAAVGDRAGRMRALDLLVRISSLRAALMRRLDERRAAA